MKRSRIFLIATPVAALFGILFLLIAYGTAFDPAISHYFAAKSPFPILAALFLILSIASGIAGAILAAKKEPEVLAQPAISSYASIPAAVGAFGTAVWLFTAGKTWLGILSLLATAFWGLCASPLARTYGKTILWAGFGSIIATIAYNATFYFDMSVEMNAPTKILLQMALLAAMLFVTAECRLLLGRFDRILIPVLTIFCLVLCMVTGLVVFYLLLAKKETNTVYLAAAPLLLGVGATAGWRLWQMLFPKKAHPDEKTESEEGGE